MPSVGIAGFSVALSTLRVVEMMMPKSFVAVAGTNLNVCSPAMVVRFPFHPPLKDLAGPRNVSQDLLHMDVFVPELIHPWQDLNSSIPHISGVIDEAVPHLHLSIFEPDRRVGMSNFQCPLPD